VLNAFMALWWRERMGHAVEPGLSITQRRFAVHRFPPHQIATGIDASPSEHEAIYHAQHRLTRSGALHRHRHRSGTYAADAPVKVFPRCAGARISRAPIEAPRRLSRVLWTLGGAGRGRTSPRVGEDGLPYSDQADDDDRHRDQDEHDANHPKGDTGRAYVKRPAGGQVVDDFGAKGLARPPDPVDLDSVSLAENAIETLAAHLNRHCRKRVPLLVVPFDPEGQYVLEALIVASPGSFGSLAYQSSGTRNDSGVSSGRYA
jgi:hypothetical protein